MIDANESIFVMTTETWAYYHSQLDRKRQIKLHALRPPEYKKSYCGLKNHDDVGEYSWEEIRYDYDFCSRCKRIMEKNA